MLRFVSDVKKPVSEVLEEGVSNELSPPSKLSKIWGSGVIKDKILEELDHFWRELAKQGRGFEEAARAPFDGRDNKCDCGSMEGHPEIGRGGEVDEELNWTETENI